MDPAGGTRFAAAQGHNVEAVNGETTDAALEAQVRAFLSALDERLHRDEIIRERTAAIEKPTSDDPEALQQYLDQLTRVYADNLGGLYDRIASHGQSICNLTDEPEITDVIGKMMALAAVESADIIRLLKSAANAANRKNLRNIAAVFVAGFTAGARRLPRQAQLDQLTLDLTAYCLTRFPPPDQG
jgi:hypothetical protein